MSEPTGNHPNIDDAAHRPFRFWWFSAEQTAQIRAQLDGAGDGACLQIHPQGDPSQIIARVVGGAGVQPLDGGGTNNSFRCPPFCP